MRRLLALFLLAGGLAIMGTAGAQTPVTVTCPPGQVPLPLGSPGAPGCGIDLSNDVIPVDPVTGQPLPRSTTPTTLAAGCRNTGTTVPGGAIVYVCVDPNATSTTVRPAAPAGPRPSPRIALTG
jgi:hypothetical protein